MVDLELCKILALSFHRTTRVDYDDLFQEAALCWVAQLENNNRYDESKSALNTFASWVIRNHLITYTGRNKKHAYTDEIDPETPAGIPGPDANLSFQEMLSSLSDDARTAVRIVFDSPHGFLALGGGRAAVRSVVDALVRKGFSIHRAKRAVREVRAALA